MPSRTDHENLLLRTLTPHAQAHARQLIEEYPLLRVSSARRSPRRNKQVGGVPGSFHLRGRAVDLVGPDHDLRHAAALAWTLRIGTRCTGPEEVLLERLGQPGAHLHVAW
jgi:uncharacterized protein YcbK (DUF882 family)